MIRRGLVLMAAGAVVAACGSGRSILEAGNEPVATVTTTTVADGPAATTPDGSTVPTSTAAPLTVPPTTQAPLAELPPCPYDVLATATEPVQITYWHGMNATTEEALQALTDTYNASQDQVRVTLENQGGYQEVFDKYYQSSTDARPELVMFPEWGFQQAVDSASIVPAGACIQSSGFDTTTLLPQALRTYAQAGVQWGMPFNVSNPLLYYNRTMFAAAGLPDRAPASFDELRQFSQTLVDTGVAASGLAYDVNFDGGGGWYIEQWFANSGELVADHFNGRDQPATEVLFDEPGGVRLLTELQALANDGLLVNVGDNASNTDAFLKMADATAPAAMAIGTSASLGTILNALGSGLIAGVGVDDIGVGPMPTFSGVPSAAVGGAANYVVDGHGDLATAAAWDFAQYLVSAQTQAEWAATTGYVPIATGALDLDPLATRYADDPRFRVAYDVLVGSPVDAAHAGPTVGPHRQVRVELAGAVSRILAGADVASTLADTTARANALIAQYNALNQ